MARFEVIEESFIGNATRQVGDIVDDSAFAEGFKYDPKRDLNIRPLKDGKAKATTNAPAAARVGGEGRTTDEGEPTNEGGENLAG